MVHAPKDETPAPDEQQQGGEQKAAQGRKEMAMGCGFAICLVALAVIVTLMVTSGSKEPETVRLSAGASTGGGELRIENRDGFAWFDIELKLNGEYLFWQDSLSAGAHVTIPLREFTDNYGARFNWQTTKPLELVVIACVRSEDGTSSQLCPDGMHWGHSSLRWQ